MRVIHHTFGPLADARQCMLSLWLLCRPWKWKNGMERLLLRRSLTEHFSAPVYLFASGREALLAFFRSLNLAEGDEVIVQGYTCVVIPNAVIAAGAKPVFVDIEKDTLSLDVHAVEKALTPRTRVVVCQHTFGLPAPLQELRDLCSRHNVILIEDCAHVIPDQVREGDVGGTGGAVLLSFGRDKAVSGITGGALVCRTPHAEESLGKLEVAATDLSFFTIKRYLLYPLLYRVARPVYGVWLGKAILKAASILRLLPPIVTNKEKEGKQSPKLHALPNACAMLALQQLRRLQYINAHRRSLVRYYLEQSAAHGWPVLHGIHADAPLQKYPLFVEGAERIRRELKKRNVHLYDGWTGCVVCPEAADACAVGYRDGDDPRAEDVCEQILCFPTHPGTTRKDAERLVRAFATINR